MSDKRMALVARLVHDALVDNVWEYISLSKLAKGTGLDYRTIKNWVEVFKECHAALPTVCASCGCKQNGTIESLRGVVS